MLDIQFIRDNAEAVQKNAENRGMSIDIQQLLNVDQELRTQTHELNELQARRNTIAKELQSGAEQSSELVEEGKQLKKQIAAHEQNVQVRQKELEALLLEVPNMSHPNTPIGASDADNKQVRTWGEIPDPSLTPLDHVELGKRNDLIDFETGAEVSGSGFYYLKNAAALMEMQLMNYAMQWCSQRGYTPMLTPDMVRPEVITGAGFNPRSNEETQIYSIEGQNLSLIATAEIAVGGYFKGRTFKKGELDQPQRVAAFSHCFRTEAGAYGKESRGLYRVHQFSKVELFVVCTPEQSDELLEEIVGMEEEILQHIQLPYRVVEVCTGDMGAPAYRKYDIEAWMPFKKEYGEVTSASNCTDFQARRLNIKFENKKGKKEFVHTLNGTAMVSSRMPLALIELNQQPDGTVALPTF